METRIVLGIGGVMLEIVKHGNSGCRNECPECGKLTYVSIKFGAGLLWMKKYEQYKCERCRLHMEV